jgi:hypothetical protein
MVETYGSGCYSRANDSYEGRWFVHYIEISQTMAPLAMLLVPMETPG